MGRLFHFLNVHNRVYYHLLFWLCYYIYRVLLYGDIKNTFENVAYVQALEIILKIGIVYFVLFFLKPHFFNTKRYFYFLLTLVITICVASYLQLYIIWFCVNLGIYAELSYEQIFSRWKFFSTMGHINSILFVTFVIKVVKEAFENAQVNSNLLKEKLEAELQFLKSQINPHFFFNTLNNLYSLTIKKSGHAPQVVLMLSDLMSYMIYDTVNQTVKFSKELKFIENYVELEKLRYGDFIKVTISVSEDLGELDIPPLLFLPFIENAFKHGVAKGESINFIEISFDVRGDKLYFTVLNTKPSGTRIEEDKNGGIGLVNAKRRLAILYPNGHKMKIDNGVQSFKVEVTIDLKNLNQEMHENKLYSSR
ncbi:histidine kinase [Reichenbachiella sp. MALMAid0571]|uniref:sensor histidine kinase n=1 Tax=Reichenbachiella sp. MALMAid0571 TaxID=3143939 RepID=UPI0032DEC39A